MSELFDPEDVSVFGPARRDEGCWIDEGVHYAGDEGSMLPVPGIPRTRDPARVTCLSCISALPPTMKKPAPAE